MAETRPSDWSTRIADALLMDGRSWARHANPWSFWTRLPILPLIALAIWSRAWIGWWCLVPLAALLAWVWLNPRAFPAPRRAEGWMGAAVLGEQVWLARGARPIPQHHAAWATGLSALAGLGVPPLVWGLWAFEIWPLLLGLAIILGSKLWFLDRMAWLYADMATQHPEIARMRDLRPDDAGPPAP